MTTPERKVTRFRLLRAVMTPLLVIGLVIGARAGVGATRAIIDVSNSPPEGHAAGFVGMAIGLVAVAGYATAINCAVGLWLFWRRWKPKATA